MYIYIDIEGWPSPIWRFPFCHRATPQILSRTMTSLCDDWGSPMTKRNPPYGECWMTVLYDSHLLISFDHSKVVTPSYEFT